jgi:hypothetical protein
MTKIKPKHKLNSGMGATLCNICNTIITPFLTDELYCDKHKNMDKDEIIAIQKELIDLLMNQVVDLSMMSKIELGDDVIAEIKRLKDKL